MATTIVDVTGVIVFDGPPVLTPAVKLFFEPFDLARIEPADDPFGYSMLVRQIDGVNPTDWSDLAQAMKGAGDICGMAPASAKDMAGFIDAAGARFCHEEDKGSLRALVAGIDFNAPLDLVDIFRIARLLRDGHNLKAMSIMGAHRCDKPMLWHFGGFAHYEDGTVSLRTRTIQQAVRQARQFIGGEAPQAAADMVRGVLEAMQDPQVRALAAEAIVREARGSLPRSAQAASASVVKLSRSRHEPERGARQGYQCHIEDHGHVSGQVRISIGGQAEMLGVVAEIGAMPGGREEVPCCHVSLGADRVKVSIYHSGAGRLLLRPEQNVAVMPTTLLNGEKAYLVR